jgi:galactose mutarotase-like enzyme
LIKFLSSNEVFVRSEQGFEVYGLQNQNLEISLVPQLGAKIISLVNRRTGREWMSRPACGPKLFHNRLGDDFATSTLVGWDECLPTIAPCLWKNRKLPDHGEVWSRPWSVDQDAFNQGVLKTSIVLAVSPFRFERSITLLGNKIQLDYELENLGNQPEEFLWAMHPLVPTCPGDALELAAETRELLANSPWLGSLEFGTAQPACAKTYAGPLHEGRASIKNLHSGDRMTFLWDTKLNHTLGVWLTRGGWNGHHHLALEPSNGSPDALTDACAQNQCGLISPRGKLYWQVTIQIEPAIAIAAPNEMIS